MKTISLLLALTCLSITKGISQIIEQPLAVVTYTVKKETHFLGLYECSLIFDKEKSLFTWKSISDASLQTDQSGGLYTADRSMNGVINFIDFKHKKLISRDFVQYDKKTYLVDEELANLHWNITNNHKKIGAYTVTEAKTSFRGREYTAWFTDEIPVKMGPWKLHGLPGLILEVHDQEKEIFFSVKKISKMDSPFTAKDFFDGQRLDLITFHKKNIDAPFLHLKKVNARSGRENSMEITGVNYNFLEKTFEYLAKNREEQISKSN
ncbi:GLPGLI family protein [Aquimarina algiphila]|uniref:GLPGLI family protein n=1 Tax=Aquimarina algiphila TaxID=2047982 RepID=UPI00232FFEC0|nr:GLPGLI family protein [Aquimarina algiphila]